MPSYFAGYEIVASTSSFLITCEDDPGARQRAQYVGATCEADLATLNDLFSTDFAAQSPHGIWVIVLKDDPTSNANGWNLGYETEESSRIVIRRAFTPPPPSPPSIIPPDPAPLPGPNLNNAVIEFPRFVFVAELAEILMQLTGYGWDPGHSPGEGLSNLLGALLHPAGYYDSGQGPRINSWLNGGNTPPPQSTFVAPRTDFVSNTLNTDKDIYSYGCAILFIHYLVSQLGHPLKDVIRAGGSTLAETYARVTGQPAAQAFNVFNQLLQAHIGNSTTNNMRRDNIFPLQDVQYRSIQTTQGDTVVQGTFTDAAPVSWMVKPGLVCPPALYDFFRQHQLLEQPVFANAIGMADAAFRWTVQDQEVAVRNTWTNITVNVPLEVRNPDGTKTTVANQVNLNYGILDLWNTSVLYLKTLSSNGNCELDVRVAAAEKDIPGDAAVNGEETVDLTTVSWLPGPQIQKDRKRCNPFYARVNKTIWYLTQELSDLKNRPDPPSEAAVRQIVEQVGHLEDELANYARAANLPEKEVLRQFGRDGGLRSAQPEPPVQIANRQSIRETHAPQPESEEGREYGP